MLRSYDINDGYAIDDPSTRLVISTNDCSYLHCIVCKRSILRAYVADTRPHVSACACSQNLKAGNIPNCRGEWARQSIHRNVPAPPSSTSAHIAILMFGCPIAEEQRQCERGSQDDQVGEKHEARRNGPRKSVVGHDSEHLQAL